MMQVENVKEIGGIKAGIKKVSTDPMSASFAKTMEILTLLGLCLMIVPGMTYIVSGGGLVSVEKAIESWGSSASEFWMAVDADPDGYSWFLDNLTYMDCLSILGIVFLALAPLAAIIASSIKANTKYKVILTIVAIELIIAIVRPLFMQTVGH